ncbi:MAG: transposase, partial [Rhodobacterales bacterium]
MNACIHLPVIDGEAFAAYVTQVLLPELEPGTVVILDNLATHKNAAAAKAMREARCWFLLTLPPTFIQRERDSGFEF